MQHSVVGIYRQKPIPVGSFGSNALGIYDMSGNVWEACSDWYSSYNSNNQINPTGNASETVKVIRGGSFNNDSNKCRSTFRSALGDEVNNTLIEFEKLSFGFRLARSK